MRVLRIIVVAASVALGGCEGLAGLGGALVSTVGGGAVEAIQNKAEARARWRAEDERIRSLLVQTIVTQAMIKLGTGEVDAGIDLFKRALTIHTEGQPKWMIQELREGR